MNLLERYLQAVGEHLPGRGKADTLAELRTNLIAEIEGREEELARPLTEDEVAALLARHGRPVLVAARYRPQQFLIGPGLFPLYWLTLKKSLPLVVLAYTAVQVFAFAANSGGFRLGLAIGHFPTVLLIFWAVMTLGFAAFEYAQGRYIGPVHWTKPWDPRDLPDATDDKAPSMAGRIADLVVSLLFIAWLLAVPNQLFLILGPGAALQQFHVGVAPAWHTIYWQIAALFALTIPLKIAALYRTSARWRGWLALATHALGTLALAVVVEARMYLVPLHGAGSAPSVANLALVSYSINLSFRIALAVSVIKFVWDLFQLLRADSRSRQAGCAAIW